MKKNKEQAIEIAKKFDWITDGIRVIMLTKRNKEGGKAQKPDRVAYKVISRNKKEFVSKLENVLSRFTEGERIYVNVNKRDIEKAIRNFKQLQLDNDYQTNELKHCFYVDIWNRMISSLMKPSARAERWFLIDIDNDDKNGLKKEFVEKRLKEEKIMIRDIYPTKNGWHFITEPFEYPKLIPELKQWDNIKIDGLSLVKF